MTCSEWINHLTCVALLYIYVIILYIARVQLLVSTTVDCWQPSSPLTTYRPPQTYSSKTP